MGAGRGRGCRLRTHGSSPDPDVTEQQSGDKAAACFWGGSGSLEQGLRVHLGRVVEGPDCPAGVSPLGLDQV